MITVKDIDFVLSEIAPKTLSESWDNDGIMLCKSFDSEINKVLIMLDVTKEGIDFAIKGNYDMIISHHPFIFKPLSSITGDEYLLISKLISNEITVCSYHTRMDSAEQGVNSRNAELLGLENVSGFGGESMSIGKIGTLKNPMRPEQFGTYLKDKFNCGNIRASYFKNSNRVINRVAVVGGAGKSFFKEAYVAGADAFVTSEAAHNTFIDCMSLDMCLYDCGHYYTENPVCVRLKEMLENKFSEKLIVDIFDVGCPYINI